TKGRPSGGRRPRAPAASATAHEPMCGNTEQGRGRSAARPVGQCVLRRHRPAGRATRGTAPPRGPQYCAPTTEPTRPTRRTDAAIGAVTNPGDAALARTCTRAHFVTATTSKSATLAPPRAFSPSMRALVVLLAAFTSSLSAQREWWASPTGNDATGDGTQARPFRTVSRCLTAAAASGDTIRLTAGTFGDQEQIHVTGKSVT